MKQEELRALLERVVDIAVDYRAGAATRPHRPDKSYDEALKAFATHAPQQGVSARVVIDELAALAEGGFANMIGPRFFGWVIGASAPVGLAADWLTSGWAQNTGNAHATPSSSACEEIAARWIVEMIGLPEGSSVGFVTGGTMANFTCLAAARNEVLKRAGWDVEADGLYGAPEVHVVLGDEAHSTVFSALRYLGLGANRVKRVGVDAEGRIDGAAFKDAVNALDGPIIAIAQAGHINSGAFDPFNEIADACAGKNAWLHVDGAIGLWAGAVSSLAQLAAGLDRADSWGADGHKWLQTPHDCGYAIVRDPEAHRRAMSITASYLPAGDVRHPADFVPELSRRARGFATWAMLRHLGKAGVAAMVERHCALARRMARNLAADHDIEIMNDVVLNQVAVRLGVSLDPILADKLTEKAITRIQHDGVCFVGGAQWRGRQIIRVSVIGEGTTEDDIDKSAEAMVRAWRVVRAEEA